VSLREQIGPDVARFLRWLVDRGEWSVSEVLSVVDDPAAWEPEWLEWTREVCAVSVAELEGEDRANCVGGSGQ
jgi:hypothetical protein